MKRAAIGVRVHSGWAALVAVAGGPAKMEVIDRRRVDVIDAKMPGAKQPYHFVRDREIPAAEAHLAQCAATAERMALGAMQSVAAALRERGYRVAVGAVLLGSGRALPPLPEILASHPMLHTAEGVFFREAFRKACCSIGVPVETLRERDLEKCGAAAFGKGAARVRAQIERARDTLGPPWTADHKAAALAAMLALHSKQASIG